MASSWHQKYFPDAEKLIKTMSMLQKAVNLNLLNEEKNVTALRNMLNY